MIPADHYSEIVVGRLGDNSNNLGPVVRVQPSGSSIDSHYLWWASKTNGLNEFYRVDANGSSYTASPVLASSPVADGDRLRLIARGQVIYGIRNGVREFIYNTGPDAIRYSTACSNFAQIAIVAGTTFDDTGLPPATTCTYRVRAADAAGNLSPYSNTASATTLAF